MIRLITTLTLTLFYGQLFGCVCDKIESVKESMDRYTLIFHGRVVEKSVVPYSTIFQGDQLNIIRERLKNDKKKLADFEADKILRVTFEVIEIFKGDSIRSTVTIFTSTNTSCDIDFKTNKDYLIYGTRKGFNNNRYVKYADNNNELIKESLYWTHYCTRTSQFNEQERQELIKNKK